MHPIIQDLFNQLKTDWRELEVCHTNYIAALQQQSPDVGMEQEALQTAVVNYQMGMMSLIEELEINI